MIRALAVLVILTLGALVLISFLSMAQAKQEQVKPEGPLPTAEKQIPAPPKCRQPMRIDFWVMGENGKLKLAGYRIIEGKC
ncbi:hypothetical protein TAL182_CH03014 [Rhizobium sp. TAL182]|uniref:hypothetical protein n=1 Tax=Rhizobium sp. TAL182 TaxID=2020313 RepID=UPI000A20F8D4|nr:hypothetical protein [Rhizobium sp. TAL182]ARO24760.1 hypothetical protein TAL182_CH03014 [Rhizobium sp. TAL182]